VPGKIQPAQVAGTWYPGNPDELTRTVDRFLARVEPIDGDPIGLVVPHAGYDFSGPVAAYSFRQLQGKAYDVAIILAADHQPPVSQPISIWAEGGFQTPLGVVPVDVELAHALMAADSQIAFTPATFEGEHPIEMQLPFLQRTCPTCKIVPILMGTDDDETVQALAKALLSVLPGRRAVIIASSDLSHYPSRADAQQIDGFTLGAIEQGDPAGVRSTIKTVMSSGYANLATCACGEAAILVMMQVAKGLGADTVSILHRANSADAGGDPNQVVGYGAVMFWRYNPPELSRAQRQELLSLARSSIAGYLKTGQVPDYTSSDVEFSRRLGAFVTLTKQGELRGCIGRMTSALPLRRTVQEMAVAAASSDPRFPVLTPEELEQVKVEISILSPLRRVADVQDIQVGTHGLMIVKNGYQGVLLPQVPVQQGWNRDQYLEQLCFKAGLQPGCWRANATLYAFTAVVFGEE
jgi:hypothetical protein